MKLSAAQLREFAENGYVLVRSAVGDDALERASAEVERLVAAEPPPEGRVGQHFYWITAPGSPPLFSLFHDTPVAALARSLVEPGEVEIAFDQVQVALNIPPFDHRPGRHHLDGYLPDRTTPASFTLLAAVLLTDQEVENGGNLWVWPGTHRTHAAYFREHGPDALVASQGYPDIPRPEPAQIVGRRGDVLLAHYMLGHNIGGNFSSPTTRRAIYWRVRRTGHTDRWRECLTDELLEFDAVREALAERTSPRTG